MLWIFISAVDGCGAMADQAGQWKIYNFFEVQLVAAANDEKAYGNDDKVNFIDFIQWDDNGNENSKK